MHTIIRDNSGFLNNVHGQHTEDDLQNQINDTRDEMNESRSYAEASDNTNES